MATDNHLVQFKSPRSKVIVLLLSLFLGIFWVHRFYLRQYASACLRGILSLLCSVLLGEKFSPVFFTMMFWLPILDAMYLMLMPKVKFDKKFNQRPKFCATCGKKLSFISTPTFDSGILSDGKGVCVDCLKKIVRLDPYFESQKHDTESVKKEMLKVPTPTPIAKGNSKNLYFSTYHELLKQNAEELKILLKKMSTDSTIRARLKITGQMQSSISDFLVSCITYDLVQTINTLRNNDFKDESLEAFGLLRAASGIIESMANIYADSWWASAKKYQSKQLVAIIKTMRSIGDGANPLGMTIQESNDGKMVDAHKNLSDFALPAFLCVLDSPLLEEYATTLHRFATIIAKADEIVTSEEEQKLKELYDAFHYPIPQKWNDSLHISKNEPEKTNETINDVLEELNVLIGLKAVKEEVSTLINFIKVQKEREKSGLKTTPISYHIVFTGNPGTGKTTVARIVAKMYRQLGILNEGHLVETDRSGLVAEYSGQTAPKVNKAVQSALNGILFIDEAYSLVGENKDDFGKEAVATLIKRMEDNRDKLVVILAGYTNEMTAFINTNPGFQSRFNRYIEFPDYTPDELLAIFESSSRRLEYTLTPEATAKVKMILEQAYCQRSKSFGNARFVRNIFEKTIEQQANRIAKLSTLTKENLTTIEAEDVL
jgi:SpoVK/Ycf46/Vps4 family AAA+-type ATPase/TM2 domain-containing membrane protein YozV